MHYYYFFCNIFNNLNYNINNNLNKKHNILISNNQNSNHITIIPIDIGISNISFINKKKRYNISENNQYYTLDGLFDFFKIQIYLVLNYNENIINYNENIIDRLCVLFILIFYNRLELHKKLKNTRNNSKNDSKNSTKECKKYLTTFDYKKKFKTNNKIILPSDYLCYDNGSSRKKFDIFSKNNQKYKIIEEFKDFLKNNNNDINKAFKYFNKINNQLIEFIKYVKIISLKDYSNIYDPPNEGTKQTIGTYKKTYVPSFIKKITNPEYIKSDYLLHVEKMNIYNGENQYKFYNNEFRNNEFPINGFQQSNTFYKKKSNKKNIYSLQNISNKGISITDFKKINKF